MKLKFLSSIFFTLAFTFWPLTVANANPAGLKVEVYVFDFDGIPERKPYTLCPNSLNFVSQIDDVWGDGVIANCQADNVLIHYSGFFVSPRTGDVTFTSHADDGFFFTLNNQIIIDDWRRKGCSGSATVLELVKGEAYKFDGWWFDSGGQACNRLFWGFPEALQIVPESAFYRETVIVDPEPPIEEPEPPVIPPKPPVEPPIVIPEPVIPEPTPEPSSEPVEPILPIVPEPPVVEPTLDDLWDAAQEDDIQVPEALADIPLLGETAVAVINAINFVGNVGADMKPEVREQAQQTLVSAVIVTQVAQLSTQTAMNAAAGAVSAGSPRTRKIG